MITGAAVRSAGWVSAMLRHIGLALVFIALALIAVVATGAVRAMHTGLEDLRQAHSIVSKQNDSSVEQMLFAASERMGFATLLAVRVAGAIGGLALLGAIVFAIVGSASRWLRLSSLAIVILLLVRAFFWEII
jgi:uncharacterized membrane protein